MSNKEVEYEQPPDYTVTYADNVILQLGENNPKLIFYQEITKVNDSNNDIEKNKRCKRLKFEVRIPRSTLEKLSTIAFALLYAEKTTLKSTEGKDDAKVTRAWYEVNNVIRSTVYDTENYGISQDDLMKFYEAASNLSMQISQRQAKDDVD
jgi:hypothetical protein